jgi:hypothetical protein
MTIHDLRSEQLPDPEISPACSAGACVDCSESDLFGKPCGHHCHTTAVALFPTRACDAWEHAHAYAISAGGADPEQFADDYTSMLEDFQYENRYPDVPLPTPAEFIWP